MATPEEQARNAERARLQAEITELYKKAADLVKEEAALIETVTAERIAAAERGPPSDSEVGNSEPEDPQKGVLIDIHNRIMQCYTDIEEISNKINELLGVQGGRRRKTRRHRRKHRKTLRRK